MTARIDALGLGSINSFGLRSVIRGAWRLLRSDGRRMLTALAPFLLAQILLAGVLAINEVRAAAEVVRVYGIDPRLHITPIGTTDLSPAALQLYSDSLNAGTIPQLLLLVATISGTAASIRAIGSALRDRPYDLLIDRRMVAATARLAAQSLIGLALLFLAAAAYFSIVLGFGSAQNATTLDELIAALSPGTVIAVGALFLAVGGWLTIRVGFAPYVATLDERSAIVGIAMAWRLTARRMRTVAFGAWGSAVVWGLVLLLPLGAIFALCGTLQGGLGALEAFLGAALQQGAVFLAALPPLASILLLYERELAVARAAAGITHQEVGG
jgi:hypothetical protein